MFTVFLLTILVGWIAASVLGTQAYFLGEQSKPIHERNWRSENFEKLARSITGHETDNNQRVPAYGLDAYGNASLPTD